MEREREGERERERLIDHRKRLKVGKAEIDRATR